MGSLVPASGAGGLALGAWVLHRGGMDGARIARRSVAFFLIKSGVNFLAVAVIGAALAVGLFGPDLSLWLTAVPAAAAALVIGAVAAAAPHRARQPPGPEASRLRRGVSHTRTRGDRRHHGGIPDTALRKHPGDRRRARLLGVRQRRALGDLPRLRPLPPDHGGADGLPDRPARRPAADPRRHRRHRRRPDRDLIVYGTAAAGTAAAVLAYRIILFWLPLLAGGIAFASLRRDMPAENELASCAPAIAIQST